MATAWMAEKRRWQLREWLHPEPSKQELRHAYGKLLERLPWDWWATFTFEEWIHPDQAHQRYQTWGAELAQETGLQMLHARALEWQKRGVVHFHALIWGVHARTRRKDWEAKWKEHDGGWAAVFPYNQALGARYYLGKYCAKRGEIDFLRYGTSDWRPDDRRIIQG